MEIKSFSGSFFQIGVQQGKIYKRNGLRIFDQGLKNKKCYQEQLRIYKKYYPEMLDEFQGIAKGGGFQEDNVVSKFITTEILEFTDYTKNIGCTIFGLKNKNGFFVGRNYDGPAYLRKFIRAYITHNNEAKSFVAITDMGGIGVKCEDLSRLFYLPEDFINEDGLYIGMTIGYSNSWSYGLSPIHISKKVSETCSNVEEALNFFGKIPVCRSKHFFLADSEGNMAVVEHTARKFDIIRPNEEMLIHTNHYLSKKLKKYDKIINIKPRTTSFERCDTLLETLKNTRKNFRKQNVKEILNDKHSIVYQENDTTVSDYEATVWTLSLDMFNKDYVLFYGNKRPDKKILLKI